MLYCRCRESLRKTPTTIFLKDGERLVGDPAVTAVCIILICTANSLLFYISLLPSLIKMESSFKAVSSAQLLVYLLQSLVLSIAPVLFENSTF